MLRVSHGAVSEPRTARGRAKYLTEGTTPEQAERMAAYLAAGVGKGKDPWEVLADVLAERVDEGLTDYSDATEMLLGEMAADSLERGDLDPAQGHRVPCEDPEALEVRAQEMLDAALDRRLDPGLPEQAGPEPGVAPPVRGMDPKIAEALGVEPHRPLTETELATVMAGRRADGGDLPEAPGPKRQVAYVEMVWSAPKSVSVAYALAETDAERRAIVEAHRDAVEAGFAAAMDKVGNARRGAELRRGRGHVAAFHLEHYSSRPTAELAAVDAKTGEGFTKFLDVPVRGDPGLHTHLIVPNVVATEDGHVGSLDQRALHGRIHEYGAVYQAALATGLWRRGIAATLRDGFAHMPAIPDRVSHHFSRRSRQMRETARTWAAERGLDWDGMDDRAKAAELEKAVKATRLMKDGHVADFADWRRQAEEIGYTHRPVLSPEQARAPREDRIELAWATALPFLEKKLEGRAVIAASEIRTVAAQGLIATGMEDWRDVDRVTALFRERGVRQDGRMTNLLWDRDPDGAVWISTRMHEAQEQEFVAIARRLGADRSGAVRRLDTTGLTDEQAAAAEALSMRGRFAVAFGAAGVGKTHAIRPVVAAHHAEGYETWGISLANRQANELPEAGIEKARTMAVHPFLSRVKDGEITLGPKSLVVVDEVALLGTRQGLELLRIAAQTGAKFIAVGDPAQSQAQPLDAKVLTPTGFRRLGDLEVGDIVVCPDGSHASVEAIQDRGEKETYRLTFRDGRAAESCGDHLWKVWRKQGRYSRGPHAGRRLVNGGGDWAVLPLSDVKTWFDRGLARAARTRIPLVSAFALEFAPQDLPVHPYALGLLLGDGHFAHGTAHYTTADRELVDALARCLPDYEPVRFENYNYRLRLRSPADHFIGRNRRRPEESLAGYNRIGRRRGVGDVVIEHDGRSQTLAAWCAERCLPRGTVYNRLAVLGWPAAQALGFETRKTNRSRPYSPLSKALAELGLTGTRSWDKFVPDAYKRGSVPQRLEMVRGLMDTDGHVGEGGTYAVFTSTSERLARDVQEIAWSLGAVASIRTVEKTLNGKKHRLQYLVQISHPDIGQFFGLSRKRRTTSPLTQRLGLRILSIEPAGKKQTRCIAISHPDGLYVTDDYLVTHNCIEAGSFSELSARALGEANVPNMVRTVRQHSEREREIAELLRTGKTLEALRMKRDDGTLEFVAGDRQAAVERVAALWAERMRANAHRPDFALTVSAPTHDDVHDLGAAIRRASGAADPMVTVKAQDGGGTVRRLDLSEGTKLRLFARVWGQADDGRKVKAGDNGDAITVLRADGKGMRFRNGRGDEGFVAWEKFARHGGLPRLAYGYVQTTIVVQGATSHEHIAALLGGSRSITGNALYVYGSRHRETAHVVVSDAKERQDVAHKRPHGDARPIRTEDLVENMAANLKAPGHKDTALRLVDRAVALVREAPVRPDLSIAGTRHVMGQRHQRALRQSL